MNLLSQSRPKTGLGRRVKLSTVNKNWEEMLNPDDKIPHCTEGKTLKESREQCPFGGCWIYRCRSSTYNAAWHRDYIKKTGITPITDSELEANP